MPEGQIVVQRDENSLAVLIERPEYKNRFGDVLGQRAPQFMSSLLSLSMGDLKDAEPKSIIAAAMIAASLDLPINKNLGFAYIIAYKDNNQGGKKVAQFQMGYKGFIQLAQRSRQYRFINACRVFEGELVKYDKVTGELIVDEALRKSEKVVGYASYFRLTNGFEHAVYMTREQVDKHAKQYSQAYAKGWKSLWATDFDAMALKTVLKLNLQKWGPLSVQMEKGIYEDQAVKLDVDSEARYPDNTAPIPAPQIEGGGEKVVAGSETTTSAPTATETTPATAEAPAAAADEKKGRGRPKKAAAKLELVPEAKTEEAATDAAPATTAGTAATELQPKAAELMAKLNGVGFLGTEFLMFAIFQKWLPTPEGIDREHLDPADVEGVEVPEDRAEQFLEPDNFAMIIEQLTIRRAKKA